MAFRTITVKSRCKLEYSLNYLVCRGEEEKRILLDEISVLIIQNTGVSLTAALVAELLDRKVKVIFCDSKSNPKGELIPYYGSFDSYAKIKIQIGWLDSDKAALWKSVVERKIQNQRKNLLHLAKDEAAEKLGNYEKEVQDGDASNREGHAAKVYFNALFGKDFSRGKDCDVNKYLNYGYSILLSSINRVVKSFGYLTELGIHHIGEENPFNLSCDLMEPLRPYVDRLVIDKAVDEGNFKKRFVSMLEDKVVFDGANMYMDNAIRLYVQSALLALKENKPSKVSFVEYEFL